MEKDGQINLIQLTAVHGSHIKDYLFFSVLKYVLRNVLVNVWTLGQMSNKKFYKTFAN